MNSFGLSCDDITWRLIQSIPRGMRSKVVREAVKMHAPQIQELRDEYWKIELDRKIAEEKLKQERLRLEEQMSKFRVKLAIEEVDHFEQIYLGSEILVETSGRTFTKLSAECSI